MSYRKIVVPLFGSERDALALEASLTLAKRFGSHVEALFARVDPATAIPYGFAGSEFTGYAAQYAVEAAIKAAEEAQGRAQATFGEVTGKLGVPVAAAGKKDAVSAHLKVVQDDMTDALERESRLSDLVVFGPAPDTEQPLIVTESAEAALLGGARPVIYTAPGLAQIGTDRIAIAYDGSAAAAHAVASALPLITRAKAVDAFEVVEDKEAPSSLGALRAYLALHGVEVATHAVDPGMKSIAQTLLREAAAQTCELLVLGGYGHNRVREFVLGGVTRHMLHQGSPMALLMAH